jgi:lambda repressor-like predicted transcriptional regulator
MTMDTATMNTPKDPPKDPAERREWIKGQLRLKGFSLRRLATQEGVCPQAVCGALSHPSSHLEEVIAAPLGMTARQLFPERFDAKGNRLGWSRKQQRTTRQTACNVEEEQAA